jgi:putative transposase
LMERLSSIFNLTLFKNKYRVESACLPHWDYSSDGWYFVTICTKNRKKYFGDVRDYVTELSDIGNIAQEQWHKNAQLRDNVRLDEFIVMPNHIHGIIIIDNQFIVETRRGNAEQTNVETRRGASLRWDENKFGPLPPKSLQSIINHFKGAVTNWCHKNGYQNFAWQPRFYDHIIRDEKSLDETRQYIYDNPEKWGLDRNNFENLWM